MFLELSMLDVSVSFIQLYSHFLWLIYQSILTVNIQKQIFWQCLYVLEMLKVLLWFEVMFLAYLKELKAISINCY